ncbi:MAG TPA: nuclear transport factor 2 family protein, partial [Capsulimonadaceae bacterium]|nr:nuclear transport factor 2 family protein [Capsulimonadaceae bacterium]
EATVQLLTLDALLSAYVAHQVPAKTHAAVMGTLQNLGAAPATAILNAQAGVLLKKGAFVLMDATMKKVIVGLAVVAVIAVGIAIPVIRSHMSYDRFAGQDTASFIDASSPTTQLAAGGGSAAGAAAAAGGPNQAATKAEILKIMREGVEDFRERNFSRWKDYADPGLVITMPGQPSMTFPQLVQQEQNNFFAMVGPFHLTETVQSMQIQGDRATVNITSRVEGTTVKHGQMPAGMKLVSDQTETDYWRKENGRWLNTRVDCESTATSLNGRMVYQSPAKPSPARPQ